MSERIEERQENSQIAYDDYVLLPQLKDIHDRFSSGYFDRETWNMLIDLHNRLPRVVQEKINFEVLLTAENNKQMCIFLFVQIRHHLEESGFLRDSKVVEGGFI